MHVIQIFQQSFKFSHGQNVVCDTICYTYTRLIFIEITVSENILFYVTNLIRINSTESSHAYVFESISILSLFNPCILYFLHQRIYALKRILHAPLSKNKATPSMCNLIHFILWQIAIILDSFCLQKRVIYKLYIKYLL